MRSSRAHSGSASLDECREVGDDEGVAEGKLLEDNEEEDEILSFAVLQKSGLQCSCRPKQWRGPF